MIEIFELGHFALRRRTFLYKKWGNGWGFPYTSNFRRFNREMSAERTGLNAQSFVLAGGEGYMQSLVGDEPRNRLEARLSSIDKPFSSLQDLATDFIGPPIWGWQDIWQTSPAEVIAPVAVRFSES